MATARSITANQLSPGDYLVTSRGTVHRVVRDGLFERNADDSHSRRPWPKGKVEVMVSYPGAPAHVTYWHKTTRLTVDAGSNT